MDIKKNILKIKKNILKNNLYHTPAALRCHGFTWTRERDAILMST
jgi:hypothetical protein